MIDEASQLKMLLQKVRQYHLKTQQRTIEIYIRHALRYGSTEELVIFCKNLLQEENNKPGYINTRVLNSAIDSEVNNGDKIKQRIARRLDKLMKCYTDEVDQNSNAYEKLSQLESILREIKSSLKRINPKSKQTNNTNVKHILRKVETDAIQHHDAMLYAAQMMFDRLFDSLNPDSGEDYLDQRVLSDESLKKAALFDATKEKYCQLLEYHQNDKLIRDYKVSYKQYLRKNQDQK